MPRRKALYRERLAEERELLIDAGRPLEAPRGAPATLEIGMGSGQYLLSRAPAEPERLFVGVEVKEERTFQAVREARALGLKNVRFAAADVGLAAQWLPDGAFDELVVLFPDPWPKPRDARRRLVAPERLALYARRLRPRARGLFRTDDAGLWEYAKVALAATGFEIESAEREVAPGAVTTRYEKAGRGGNRPICEIRFRRAAEPAS